MFDTTNLAAMEAGQSVLVDEVGGQDGMHRRLMDLGLIPGTKVTCLGKSPAGDPAAYLIRGTVIALRGVDARTVTARSIPEPTFSPAPAARVL